MSPEHLWRKYFKSGNEDVLTIAKPFGMTEKSINEGIHLIHEWYKKQPHLPADALDDDTILRFYASSKFSTERAKEKIDNYFTARAAMPEFFTSRDPFNVGLLNSRNLVEFVICPKLTKEHYRVVPVRYTDADVSLFDPINFYRLIFMMTDLRMKYEMASGDLYVWDLKHMKLGHALKITPSLLKKSFFLAQNCYGSRIKGIYILNMSPYAKNPLIVLKSFLKKKIADRIFILDSVEELRKHVPIECLPSDMGGFDDAPTCRQLSDACIEILQTGEWTDWFKKSENLKSDETKRPEKVEDKVGDLLGIMGSFKKLEID